MSLVKFLLLLLACLLGLLSLAYYVGFEGGQALGTSAEG